MPDTRPDILALDAGGRTIDPDGHMHVPTSVISAAAVNGYLGREIPRYRQLGLDANRTYQLLRDPGELERGAPTFAGKPLLIIHRPQTAADHAREVVVGAVMNPVWEAPQVRAELVFWDDEAIDGVNDLSLSDLSSGYGYDADMTPGNYQGTAYDGVMRNIRGNHVALVADGRVDGAVVGDSAVPRKETAMAKQLSRAALLASGALQAYLRPKLAQDSRGELNKIVASVAANITKATWTADRPKLKLALDAAVKGKLAPAVAGASDAASLGDVDELLDQLQAAINDVAEQPDPDDETEEEKKVRMDKRGADKAAKDAAEAAAADPKKDDDKDKVTKPAMDAAITKAVADADAASMDRFAAIRAAEREVRPYVGELATTPKTEAGVFQMALDTMGIDTAGVSDVKALRLVLKAQPLPGAAPPTQRLALDAANSEEAKFRKLYPTASKLIRS